ncbi:MAG: hypothetical protein KAW40_00625, partial [Candidatus Aenigmarchaeota archaeon]|nr:hypothetical protein [Candidatus Aenigmarchaeota archaeon]
TVMVYFWLNSTNTSNVWEFQEQKQDNETNDTVFTFNRSYSCAPGSTGELTTWFVYFNASDEHSNIANVSTIINHTVEKDDVSINHLHGHESEVNRSDITTLVTYVYDYDSTVNTTGPSVYLWVMLNSTDWDSGVQVTPSQNYSYDFNATCNYTPGIREWKMNISNDECFKDNESSEFNVTIYGFLDNNLTSPNGETYEAGENVTFIGNVTDMNCFDDPIANASVRFIINSSLGGTFYCPSQTGWVTNTTGNNYTCEWNSSGQLSGWYNVTMISKKDSYNNGTYFKENAFYLTMIPLLKYANVTPRSDGWAIEKNFTVNVTDIGDNVTVWLWIKNSTGDWEQVGNSQECQNCNNQMLWWNKTFSYTNIGTWNFKFNATDTEGNNRTTTVAAGDYAGNDNTTTVEEDDIEFIHIYGNETTTTKESSTWFRVLVNDTDRGGLVNSSYPSANIQIEVTENDNNYLVEGSTTTNGSGYANYEFLADCTYDPGKQKWKVIVAASDNYYQSSYSDVWNVTLDIQCPEFNITEIYSPSEIFQYNPFVLNATIWIRGRDAEGTNASLQTPSWDVLPSEIRYLGTIEAGVGQENTTQVLWTVNATSLVPYEDSYMLNITANTSAPTPQGYYEDDNYTVVNAYKLLQKNSLDSMPVNVTPQSEFTVRFECSAGEYRVGHLQTNWTGNETFARIYIYNSTDWVDILHSYYLNSTEKNNLSIFRSQIAPNGSGYCLAKFENLGGNNITINSVDLTAYYRSKVSVLDMIPMVEGNETNGMVSGEDEIFNVTVKIENSINTSFLSNITLNVTNSSGYVVNSSTHFDVNLQENSTAYENFTGINLSGENDGAYTIQAYVFYSAKVSGRNETFVYDVPEVSIASPDYMCNLSKDKFNVTISHPFYDPVLYNVSVEVASGWNVSSSQTIEISQPGTGTLEFEINSSNSNENALINVTVNYTYPSSEKSVTGNYTIENGNETSILEIIRETPQTIADNKVFESALVIHNKGCGPTSGTITLKEFVSTGWTPANPQAEGGVNYSSYTDLEENILTWWIYEQLGSNEYVVATYQARSPPLQSDLGNATWTLNWSDPYSDKHAQQSSAYYIETMNYSSESHLEFDIDVDQRNEYPWP